MADMDFKEIEFKYDATGIDLKAFNKAAKALKPLRSLKVSGWDHYFSRPDEMNRFFRFRDDKKNPELTAKTRLNKKSSTHRIEANVRLKPGTTLQEVTELMKQNLNSLNFSIVKNCQIYFYAEADIVFYTVFDERNKKVGQFLEIEFLQSVKGKKVSYALKVIKKYEKALASIGIAPSKRINKTLWEMYRRKAKAKKGKKG